MTDISGISMVSYYNPLAMYRQQQQQPSPQQPLTQQVQQHSQAQQAAVAAAAAVDGGQQYWYGYSHGHPHTTHHHQSTGAQQYLEHSDVLSGWPPHPHTHHYSHHLQYQHHQAYQQHQQHQQQQLQLQQQQQQLQLQQQQQQQQQQPQLTGVTDWSGDESNNPGIVAGEPSPPITVSGSEISSPSTPSTPPSNNNNTITTNNNDNNNTPMRPAQVRSPYEWMKKPSYQSQPNPACNLAATCDVNAASALHDVCALDALGKTRTKDKYRVVYTDHQRLELEKEFHYSRYITIRRKSELANSLALSERQVKIWFQNRRAKERKQVRKREELEQKDRKVDGTPGGMAIPGLAGMGGMLSGLMHNGNSPPLALGTTAHTLPLGHTTPVLHPHTHQVTAHPHSVLGL